MQQIKVVPLGMDRAVCCLLQRLIVDFLVLLSGAGQDVGRSCVLVSIGGKNIIFDCGMHMGYGTAEHCNTE